VGHDLDLPAATDRTGVPGAAGGAQGRAAGEGEGVAGDAAAVLIARLRGEHDAAFIAAARTALPALLDELARTRAQLDEARARLAFAPGLVEAARNLETAIAGERNVQAVLGIHRIDCEPCVEMEGNACRDGAVMLKELRACRKATDAAMNTLRAALLKETP
jgi:hypothetical protein